MPKTANIFSVRPSALAHRSQIHAVHPSKPANVRRLSGPASLGLFAFAMLLSSASGAAAHVSERGLVMLLPTDYTLTGAALAVIASFLVLALLPSDTIHRQANRCIGLFACRLPSRAMISSASFICLALLVLIGLEGPTDPGRNLLPLTIWSVGWVGLTLLQALTGSLWPWLNPWTGPFAIVRSASGTRIGRKAILSLPERMRYLPAIALFLLFAWHELVSLSPQDPAGLARAVSLWWLLNSAGIVLVGEAAWMRFCEPFSILYRLIGMLSPLRIVRRAGKPMLALTWPGRACLTAPALPMAGLVFLLVTLSSVTFDGFSMTFTWLGFLGINPLEFPGRSAVTLDNTLGLLAAGGLLTAVFLGAVAIGRWLAGGSAAGPVAGRLVYSIVPISIAFHAAHYLPVLLVNGQFFLAALSDPLSLGWNLFGTADLHVSDSFMTHLDGATRVWIAQTVVIVAGHIAGIVLAHAIALDALKSTALATRSQIGLAAVMVFYTVFGLWLLSTPVA